MWTTIVRTLARILSLISKILVDEILVLLLTNRIDSKELQNDGDLRIISHMYS